jgi:hypothetical protein
VHCTLGTAGSVLFLFFTICVMSVADVSLLDVYLYYGAGLKTLGLALSWATAAVTLTAMCVVDVTHLYLVRAPRPPLDVTHLYLVRAPRALACFLHSSRGEGRRQWPRCSRAGARWRRLRGCRANKK